MVDVTVTTDPKPKSMWKTVLGVLIVLGLIAAAIYYYAWPKGEEDNTPPVLGPSAEDQLQGLTVLEGGFMKFDGTEAHTCTGTGDKYIDVSVGVTYFYPTEKVSFQDVIDAIKPVKDAQVLIAYYNVVGNSPYSPYYSGDGGNKNFYVYPNPWKADVASSVPKDKLSEYEIPPYFGFMILAKKEPTHLCANKFRSWTDEIDLEEDQTAEEFLTDWNDNSPDGVPLGWMLLPFNQDDLIGSFIDGYGDYIGSVWTQTDVNAAKTADKTDSDFTKLDVEKFVAGEQKLGDHQMVWIKFVEPEEVEPAKQVLVDYLDVTGASAVDATHVKVSFDEEADAAALVKENFTLTYSDDKGQAAEVLPPTQKIISAVAGATGSKTVLLTLDTALIEQKVLVYYKVTVSNVKSKEGEVLNPAKTFAMFQYKELPKLTVTLNAGTPAGPGPIYAGDLKVAFTKISLVPSGGAVTLKGITVTETIEGINCALGKVYVSGKGGALADAYLSKTDEAILTFDTPYPVVSDGEAYILTLAADVSELALAGDKCALGIASVASDISVDGDVTFVGVAVTGETMVIGGTSTLTVSLDEGNPGSQDVPAGTKDVVFAKIHLKATGGPVKLGSFMLYDNDGSGVTYCNGYLDKISVSVDGNNNILIDEVNQPPKPLTYLQVKANSEEFPGYIMGAGEEFVLDIKADINPNIEAGKSCFLGIADLKTDVVTVEDVSIESLVSWVDTTIPSAKWLLGKIVFITAAEKTLNVTVEVPTPEEGFNPSPSGEGESVMAKLTLEAMNGDVKLAGFNFSNGGTGSISEWEHIVMSYKGGKNWSQLNNPGKWGVADSKEALVDGWNHTVSESEIFYVKLFFNGGVNGETHKLGILSVDDILVAPVDAENTTVTLTSGYGGEIEFK